MVSGNVCLRPMAAGYSRRGAQRAASGSRSQMSITARNARRSARVVASLLFFFLCLLPAPHVWAGGSELLSRQTPAEQKFDTIYLTSGKSHKARITNVTGTRVSFRDTVGNEGSYMRRNVHKIVYCNGRTERFNALAVGDAADTDWRIVILTEDPQQVQGLFSRGMVYGDSSPSNKTLRSAQRSAETRLKKRAVAKQGIIVLVQKRIKTGGYGEVPTYRIEGEVYGTEPLPEGEDGSGDVPIDDTDE